MHDPRTTTDLFSPVTLGSMELANRIVMAPVTRSRYGEDGVPNELHATYYAQRATAGLIVAEATNISAQGRGYAATPGIWSDRQVAGWRLVTDAVHAAGGKIVSQLWHVGRFSSVDLQPNGEAPVAPSAIKAEGNTYTADGFVPVSMPRALETGESPASSSNTNTPQRTPKGPVLMALKSIRPTVTCWTSFCATRPISAPTSMAVR